MTDNPCSRTGIPVPDTRFDQKNEMFKRSLWDQAFETTVRRFQHEIPYQDKEGWQKSDFAARNAAWNVEWAFGMGNSRSNSGLYAWEGVHPKAERFVKAGGKVKDSPQRMSRLVKQGAPPGMTWCLRQPGSSIPTNTCHHPGALPRIAGGLCALSSYVEMITLSAHQPGLAGSPRVSPFK
jgi:hypothetical protein